MIRNRLAEILFERDIKITDIANGTGISRNTISNTASNNSDMLKMNTINKICTYLNITPSDFFEFIPIDIDFEFYKTDDLYLNYLSEEKIKEKDLSELPASYIKMGIEGISAKLNVGLFIKISYKKRELKINSNLIFRNDNLIANKLNELFLVCSIKADEEDLNFLATIFDEIPRNFKKIINNNLAEKYKKFILNEIDSSKQLNDEITKKEFIKNTYILVRNEFLK
ncbi:helix-turn-helix domain-containing protein [Staphylococcus haemolyticus]|uniref:helix-turn-helix domain-containing protein n=1 Tax=Staphylococcus haemolyticus TaxID=1283 RepID=UPI001F0A685C|nr:helix-turn-helix transcriptional regulator [Staphylococcus haemolyticus]MCH4336751.1 helix-turn-helix domain-containing protein [Staphylococcus haemolyticus]